MREESDGRITNHYDPFVKEIRVISVNESGFDVEGHYWRARYYTLQGQQHPTTVDVPKVPASFNVAYTAFGTPTHPPVTASVSGSHAVIAGHTGYWTATSSGGSGGNRTFR